MLLVLLRCAVVVVGMTTGGDVVLDAGITGVVLEAEGGTAIVVLLAAGVAADVLETGGGTTAVVLLATGVLTPDVGTLDGGGASVV